jgi:hypothetical protein
VAYRLFRSLYSRLHNDADPGAPEHLRLSPPAFIGPGARFIDFSLAGPHARRRAEVLHPRCRGLDVHKDTVVACRPMARLPRKFARSRRRQPTVNRLAKLTQDRRPSTPNNKPTFSVCHRGWPRTSVRMWRWRRPASTASRYGTSRMMENLSWYWECFACKDAGDAHVIAHAQATGS